MLNKRKRLTKKAFDSSFKVGKRLHSPTLQLIYDNSDSEFHGAVVVGKKVYKKAVDRNRLRRRIYGALYRYSQESKMTGTYILIAKPAAKDLAAKEIMNVVTDLIAKTT